MRILIADDETTITATLEDDLRDAGHEVVTVRDGESALTALKQSRFDVLLSDIAMPKLKGDELLVRAKAHDPSLIVVLMTGFGTIESAVNAMKAGAADYILKPFRNESVVSTVSRFAEVKALREENLELRHKLEEVAPPQGLVGIGPAMAEVRRMIEACSRTDASVLITGETGCGKEVVARAVHSGSARATGPFVAISCGAMAPTLLESELFGHEKGAFTDAKDRKIGRFERAHLGTVFLDDIDDMPLETQVKLLRVLQEREVERVGSSKSIKVDIRVVSATKVDLRDLVKSGKFRQDLYFRINVVNLRLPALRERREDIAPLAKHFARIHGDGRVYSFEPGALEILRERLWPGNVRELEHAVERAIALAGPDGVMRSDILVDEAGASSSAQTNNGVIDLDAILANTERTFIVDALRASEGRRTEAASRLSMSRKALWARCRRLGIDVDDT